MLEARGMRADGSIPTGSKWWVFRRPAHLPNGVLCFFFVVRLLVSCLLLLLPPFASCRLSASSACLLLLWAMPGFSLGTKSSVTTGGSRTFCPSTRKAEIVVVPLNCLLRVGRLNLLLTTYYLLLTTYYFASRWQHSNWEHVMGFP